MRFFQLLNTLPLYIKYFLTVVDEHSLQAPYIYDLYTTIRQKVHTSGEAFTDIEAIRKRLQSSSEIVRGSDFGAGSVLEESVKNKVAATARYGISSQKECLVKSQLLALSKKSVCLELGTSLGISTAYLSRTLPEGKIVTIEGNSALCQLAQNIWRELAMRNIELYEGNIDLVLQRVLDKFNHFDFVVMDANHTGGALIRYFNVLFPRLAQGAIVFVDDIRWSADMYRAWKEIVRDERVPLSVESLKFGLLIFKQGIPKQHYILSL